MSFVRSFFQWSHSMLSEKFSPPITIDQLSILIQQDEKIFNNYVRLEICDWGFYISDGFVIDTRGLLYYEGGVIVVQTSLHKDSDSIWRIQGFGFKPNVKPTPFGFCN